MDVAHKADAVAGAAAVVDEVLPQRLTGDGIQHAVSYTHLQGHSASPGLVMGQVSRLERWHENFATGTSWGTFSIPVSYTHLWMWVEAQRPKAALPPALFIRATRMPVSYTHLSMPSLHPVVSPLRL